MPYKIPFIGDHAPSRDTWAGAQELLNMFPEGSPTETKGAGEGRISLLPTPGLETLGTVGTGPIRGSIYASGAFYVVSGDDFYEVTVAADGTLTATQRNIDADDAVSPMSTSTGKVSMATSGAAGKQIAIADGAQVYVYEIESKAVVITDVGQESEAIVTAAGHGLRNGDKVRITGIVDDATSPAGAGDFATELNGNDFIIEQVATDTFVLSDTDMSDNSDDYSSGGLATRHRWSTPGFATDTGDNTYGTFSSEDNDSIGDSGATDAAAWSDTSKASSSNNQDATASNVGLNATSATIAGSATTLPLGDPWTNASNITANDGSYAVCTGVGSLDFTDRLVGYNFSFSIPSAAYIRGVVVTVERHYGTTASARTEVMQLYNVGGIGSTRSQNSVIPTSDGTWTPGGSSDRWGATLTPAIINSSTFGAAYYSEVGGSSNDLYVDYMAITVYYDLPTDYLRCTDRSGADLAATDIVTGIEVDIEAAESNAGRIKFQSVQLVLGGQAQGEDKGSEGGALTGADATYTFGGSGDLWGLSVGDLTASVVNSEQFGVQMSFRAADGASSNDGVQVDFANIKIYYNGAGAVAPSHIEWFDDYFIINNVNTGDFYWTANGAQLWDTVNDQATAQRDPDNIEGVIKLNREIWLLGEDSSEAWYNSGDAVPFDPIDNRFIDMGIRARYSLARYSDGVTFLAQDERGSGSIVSIGSGMTVISTPQIEAMIGKMIKITDAYAFTYKQDGHEFYQITFPTYGETFVYDYTTGAWHSRQSYGHPHHVAMSHTYHKSRNWHIVGSYSDGTLYRMGTRVFTEGGNPIVRRRIGQSVHSGLLPGASVGGYRVRLVHHGFELDCTRGNVPLNEDEHSSKATVTLSWSDDGGKTYSSEKKTEVFLNKPGDNRRIRFKSLGQSYDRRYMITTESPYLFVINDAYAEVSRGTW